MCVVFSCCLVLLLLLFFYLSDSSIDLASVNVHSLSTNQYTQCLNELTDIIFIVLPFQDVYDEDIVVLDTFDEVYI